ncbi:MAG: hypothetical protein HYW25_02175 [Candidatus Aenigmarchaeota archaeon]|nr:hypothetical protein [Candidatus Aenigmarchaeota archaeon]
MRIFAIVFVLIAAVAIAGCAGQSNIQTSGESPQSVSVDAYATVKEAIDAGASLKCDFTDVSDGDLKKTIYISDGKARREQYVRGLGPDAKISTAITVYNQGKLYQWVEDEEGNPSYVDTIDESEAKSGEENYIFDRSKIDSLFKTSLITDNNPEPTDNPAEDMRRFLAADEKITCIEQAVPDSLFVPPSG